MYPTPWIDTELDTQDQPHARHRQVIHTCGEVARESECFDVGGRWIICPKCGVDD